MDSKKISDVKGLGEKRKGYVSEAQGILGGEPILYATVMLDT